MKLPASGNKGLTLIEAVISIMIMAMAAVAIAGVLISTSVAYKKAELRQASLLMIRTVSDKLRDFVTADNETLKTNLAGSDYQGLCGDTAPLNEGEHDMTCYFEMPYGNSDSLTYSDLFPGTLKEFKYRVSSVSCCSGCSADLPCKKVDFTINYTTG